MSCFALLTHHFPTLLDCILERRKIQPTFCKLDHFLLGFVVAWNCCVLHPHDISIVLLAFAVHIYSEPIYGTFLHFAFFAHFPTKQTTDRLKCSCGRLSRKEKKKQLYKRKKITCNLHKCQIRQCFSLFGAIQLLLLLRLW